ncbi:hypothetical protein [Paenibacillus naphthalenovorans]|uniref:hypothetical protein n=1 Tax=Paenibacillus naphthalenovorans TaxID=162209 RepID=UPI003D2BA03E
MTAAFIRHLAALERARLAQIEYAIERREDDLMTLYERREDAVRSLTELERRERDLFDAFN